MNKRIKKKTKQQIEKSIFKKKFIKFCKRNNLPIVKDVEFFVATYFAVEKLTYGEIKPKYFYFGSELLKEHTIFFVKYLCNCFGLMSVYDQNIPKGVECYITQERLENMAQYERR